MGSYPPRRTLVQVHPPLQQKEAVKKQSLFLPLFLAMFVTYVLYAEKFHKIYIGYTSDLINRIKSHNLLATKEYTTKFRPWIVVAVFPFECKAQAMKHEKFLKTGKGREYIHEKIIPLYKS